MPWKRPWDWGGSKPPALELDRLMEVLQPDRCPICFLAGMYGAEHVRNFLEESVTDPLARDQLVQAGGFCNRHAWTAVDGNDSLGLAILYNDLLEKSGKSLLQKKRFWRKSRRTPCPICLSESAAEKNYVRQFIAGWRASPELRMAFFQKGFLCLRHVEAVLAGRLSGEPRKNFLVVVERLIGALRDELGVFLKKQDYRRTSEALGKEKDAWIRAVRMVSGERKKG